MDLAILEKFGQQVVDGQIIKNWAFWSLIFLGVFAAGSVGGYVTGYFKRRGEDHAAKLTREKFTRADEEIRSELKAQHARRFAALDRRVEAHQGAFSKVVSLAFSFGLGREGLANALAECRAWYMHNAVFLDERARRAIDSAFMATLRHSWRYSPEGYQIPPEHELYDIVIATQNEIIQSVRLPPLSGDIDDSLTAVHLTMRA